MDDLQGPAQERRAQLDATADPSPEWLRRQLELALDELDALQVAAAIELENRPDF